MGHITLSIADIEFVQPDEIVLDDADVILLDERSARGRRAAVRPQPRRAIGRPAVGFDDARTVVWAVRSCARR